MNYLEQKEYERNKAEMMPPFTGSISAPDSIKRQSREALEMARMRKEIDWLKQTLKELVHEVERIDKETCHLF